jgi:hypothetical protein
MNQGDKLIKLTVRERKTWHTTWRAVLDNASDLLVGDCAQTRAINQRRGTISSGTACPMTRDASVGKRRCIWRLLGKRNRRQRDERRTTKSATKENDAIRTRKSDIDCHVRGSVFSCKKTRSG